MPIETPTDMRKRPSARVGGELRSAITNASAMPIASSDVMISGVGSSKRTVTLLRRRGFAEAFFHPAIELFGDLGVVIEHLLRVGIGVLDTAQVRVCLLHALAPQADVAHGRHDARKEPLPEADLPFGP